ncbi:MAG TPA: hypothetical protein PLD37_08920 [Usitatibacteraceae bacterium]|jgi:hypothetical protein|nr:hypothetical protein [Usitatibacteraceae bacterium]
MSATPVLLPDPARVASAQRLLILSIALLLVSVGLDVAGVKVPGVSLVFALGAIVVAVAGAILMGRALGFHWAIVVLCSLAMVVDFLNLIVLAVLNARAMKVLRAAGWRVGFLGSRPPG